MRTMQFNVTRQRRLALAAMLVLSTFTAVAQQRGEVLLETALGNLAARSGLQLAYRTEILRGVKVQVPPAGLTPREELRALLEGTGLEVEEVNEHTLTIRKPQRTSDLVPSEATSRMARTDALSSGTQAETASEDSPIPGSLEEVIVTATKRSMDAQRVPVSITALSGAEIERRGAVSAADLLNSIPGVTQLDLGVGVNQIVIRGIGVQLGESAAVSSYFGEIPLNTIANGNSIDLKLVDLERVEVLRGPQGTLFGSGSMGGVVRSIPVAPDLNELEGKVELGYSSTAGLGGSNLEAIGVLNLPLVIDRLSVRAVGYRFDNSGYVENIGADVPDVVNLAQAFGGAVVNKRDIGRSDYTGLRAALLWKLNDRSDATLSLITQDLEQEGFPSVSLLRGAYQDSPLQIGAGTGADEYLGDDTDIANLVLRYDTGWAELLSTSTWFQGSRLRGVDLSRVIGLPVAQYDDNSSHGVVQELRVTSAAAERLRYSGGLYYEDSKRRWDTTNPWTGGASELEATLGPDADASAVYAGIIDFEVEQIAAFGELTYEILRNLDLTVGGRYFDYTRHDVSSNRGVLAGGGSSRDLKAGENGSTFKVDLSYTPSRSALLYVRWAEGFRLGRPILAAPAAVCDLDDDGFLDGTNTPITSDSVKSDTLDSYELGGKFAFMDRRVSVNASLYRIDWQGIPLTVRANPDCGFGVLVNAGKARSQGVEFESSMIMAAGVRVDLGVSWVDAELSESNPLLGPKGTRLPGSAKFNTNLGLQYEFAVAGGHRAFVRGNYTYLGGFRNDIAGRFAKAGDYGKLDARLGVALSRMEVELFATNLTNEDALTAVEDDPGFAYRMRPRTVGLQLRYRF